MSFDAHEEKIRKIFSEDAKYTIPRNQRKYVWEEKQWKELVGDIDYIKKCNIPLRIFHIFWEALFCRKANQFTK